MFYTYAHVREDTGAVFYIGKGRGRRAWSVQGRSAWWRAIAAKGWKVRVLATWPVEADAFEHEKFLIGCFKDMGVPLCNLSSGGDGGMTGVRLSPEACQKIRIRATGRVCAPETRARISAAKRGVKCTRPPSETTLLKRSLAARGNTAFLGRRHTAETIAKMRASHLALNEKRRVAA